MTFSISDKISEWNNTLEMYEKAPDPTSLIDRVRALYENVRQEEAASENLLGKEVSLKQDFDKVEKRVYCLFLRSTREVIPAENVLTQLNVKYFDKLIELVNRLYQKDDSKTAELISTLPEDMRNVVFKNLGITLGKPAYPFIIGEFAFLNTNNCSANPKDKYTALISSFCEEPQLLLLAGSGHVETLHILFPEEKQISKRALEKATLISALKGYTGVVEFLLAREQFSQRLLISAVAKLNAAMDGQIDVLRFLRSERLQLSQEKLDGEVIRAAMNGQIDVLRFLLPGEKKLSKEELEGIVIRAAMQSQIDLLHILLPETMQLSEEALRDAVIRSSHKNHIRFLDFFSSYDEMFSQITLDKAVEGAAKNGHTEVIAFLLSNYRELSPRGLQNALNLAAANGHTEVLKFLLSKKIKLFQTELENAVGHAAENGHKEVIAFLLSDNRKLSEAGLDAAAEWAAANGHKEVLEFLLSNKRKLSQQGLVNAVEGAAANGHTEVLKVLISKERKLSEAGLDAAAKWAAKNNHKKVLEFLLSEGRTLSEAGLDATVRLAAENGHKEVLELFLSEGRTLSEAGLDATARLAAKNGHTEVLEFLLSGGRTLSAAGLDATARLAAENGHKEVLELLLSEGRTLSEAGLDATVRLAAENGHKEVLEFLFSADRQITDETRSMAVLHASKAGHLAALEFLLGKGPILAFYHNASNVLARRENRDNIHALLREAQIIPSNDMPISLQSITQDPKAFLEKLTGAPLPNAFILNESPLAFDLGGLSKQVYSTLFSSLLEKNLFHVNDNGLACIEQDSELKIFRILGSFYSHFVEKNKHRTDLLLTEHVFSSAFFSLVKIMVEDPNDYASLLEQLGLIEKNLQPFIALLKDKTNEELRKRVICIMFEFFFEEGDAIEFAEKVIGWYVKPVRYLIEGARESGVSDAFFNKVRELTPDKLAEHLQGQAISKELILSSLKISNKGGVLFKEKIEWLKKVISDADQAWLRKFTFATTGRYVFTSNTRIEIRPNLIRVNVFEFHPCGNILDLPSTAMTQTDFSKGLDASLQDY